ncbi:hypothetical protein DXG01_014003 [Tephrocybe rancida]|nr:hypothetical protein DXG01_014003 [Tephrocybe rancida]
MTISHLLCLALLSCQALGLNISIPLAPPSAAPQVSPSLVSFSIEQDRWTDWAGSTSRNQFFFNVLDNLRQLTGAPPRVRIGADSEDHTKFNAAIGATQLVFPAPTTIVPYPEATNITVGDAFYQATQFLPPNTHVTWGLNFGQFNLTTAFLEAKSIAKAFSSAAILNAGIVLDAIEIGNEADLYRNNGARPGTYSVTQYVQEWTTFATNISAAMGISSTSSTKFWGAAFAGSSHSSSNGGFSPQSAFSAGLLTSAAGKSISTVSQHHYSGSFCSGSEGLLQDLMTKSTVRGNLSSFTPDIAAARSQGLDYVFGETNSYSCHGAPGVSNTAGASLWALDYVLFATQIGISRVYFHEGIGYKYNLIQPATLTRSILDGSNLANPLPPHVQPSYYGAIIVAEALGASGSARVAEISISNAQISGYGFYEGTKLVRAVFINSNAFLTSTGGNRPSVHLDLGFTGTGTAPAKISVKRLAIGHADDQSGLTWGGQSYETADGRAGGSVAVQTGNVASGVDIAATEAVLALNDHPLPGAPDKTMSLHVDSFTFRAPDTDLQSTAKRYTRTVGASRDGLTLLLAHGVGSRKTPTQPNDRSLSLTQIVPDKEQWEPTLEQIFRLQQSKGNDRIREAWAFDWQSHGEAAVLNEELLKSYKGSVYTAAVVEYALSLEYFVKSHLKGHRVVAVGHSAGTGAILLSMKNSPAHSPPYVAVFLVEPTILSQELFDSHAKERENAANMTMRITLARRDSWPDRGAATAYLRRRLPWKAWDSRVFDTYINYGLRGVATHGNAAVLKTNKRQEGMAYPQFAPYIESVTLFRERCKLIPFHIIFGERVDFMYAYERRQVFL